MNRRELLGTLAAAVAVSSSRTGSAAPPIERRGPAMMKLSLAAYSFNRLMARRGTADEIAKAEMSLEKFIDFCADCGLGAAELTGYYFPAEITHEYLVGLKTRTHRSGLSISGTAIGNDFCVKDGPARERQLAECREWIDHAAVMGAPVIRIFAGKVPKGDSEEAALERCIEGINESLQYAETQGVCLALENHGGITATPEQLLRIVAGVNESPCFGVNFDSGNFRTADPYGDLAKIAPYAVNAQVKVAIAPNGQKEQADLARIIGILKDSGYRGFVALEFEEREDPFTAIPPLLDQLRKLISG